MDTSNLSSIREKGFVVHWRSDKQFGFIIRNKGPKAESRIFFCKKESPGYRKVKVKDRVSFRVVDGDEKGPRAIEVQLCD